jgi:SAM-dependent methyltransferase
MSRILRAQNARHSGTPLSLSLGGKDHGRNAMTDPDWWRAFFSGPWSRIQADGYPDERTNSECDLIQNALDLKPGARVLDIPCGIVRHTVEFARRGFEMTGVDLSREYIKVARTSAAEANVAPQFLICDMREFVSGESFDAAFCYFGSFGYFLEDDEEKFARAVAQSLRSGGRFLIEGHIAETLLPIFRERDWVWLGPPDRGVRLLQDRTWDVEGGRVENVWTIVDRDGTQSSESSMRIYTYPELSRLLRRAGFSSVALFDGRTGKAFRFGANRALVVAEIA